MIAEHTHAVSDAREIALASAALIDASFLDDVPDFSANDIRDEFAALLIATAIRQYRDGGKPDLYTVAEALDRGGAIAEKLGPDAMQRMLALVQSPMTSDPAGLARSIHAEAQRRRLVSQLELLRTAASDPTFSTEALQRQLTAAADGLQVATDCDIPALTSAELDAGDFSQAYLVEDVLAAGQPCILAAPKKCLKTNISIDLTLSLASRSKFLDKFYVPREIRVALISGESGRATIQETARRIARSKPWMNLADYGNAVWSFDLPQLSDHASLISLRQFIRRQRLDVVILDPAYLLLAIGDDAGNLFKVGETLWPLSRMAQDEGVTPIIVHHLVKGVAVTESPPELEGIAWAGFQEWARQWMLLSRRAKYEPDNAGHHELWFTAGGSAGHSVAKAIDIDEGDRRDTGGRRWQVDVRAISEAIEAKVEAAADAKEQRQQAQHAKAVEKVTAKVLEALESHQAGLTARRFKSEYGIGSVMLTAIVQKLSKAGTVKECEIVAANKQTYQGWQLSKYSEGTTGNDRVLVQCDPVIPSDAHTALHCAPLL